jgi:hypothetical protein
MFRALFADPQEVLNKRQLLRILRYVSWLHQVKCNFNPGTAN